jgi:hypothetical protein
MELLLEDLPQQGLWLIGPSSPHFDTWLAEIRSRQAGLPAVPDDFIDESEKPGSAIWVNGSGKDVAAWSLIWRFEDLNGRITSRTVSTGGTATPSLLHPFGLSEEYRRKLSYSSVILAGSKRWVGGGRVVGSNADVRQPAEEERSGGMIFGFGRGGDYRMDWSLLRRTTIVLDGVFFVDGTFAGPDRAGLWVRMVRTAEVTAELARIAYEGRARGDSPQLLYSLLAKAAKGPVEAGTPPPPPTRPASTGAVVGDAVDEVHRSLGAMIGLMRQHSGDEAALDRLASWHGTVLPDFRRL